MKECSICKEKKGFDCFYKDKRVESGIMSACKKCKNKSCREYNKANKDKVKENKRKYRKNNYEEILEKDRLRYQKNKHKVSAYHKKNKDLISQKKKEYRENNLEYVRLLDREKYYKRKKENPEGVKKNQKDYYERNKNNETFKLLQSLRYGITRISRAVKQQKELRSLEYLGCSLEDFKTHIESLWSEGMTWDNYGLDGWHIDHKVPLDWYVKNSDDPWEANHYTNLQPLWAKDNIQKSNKLLNNADFTNKLDTFGS